MSEALNLASKQHGEGAAVLGAGSWGCHCSIRTESLLSLGHWVAISNIFRISDLPGTRRMIGKKGIPRMFDKSDLTSEPAQLSLCRIPAYRDQR